MPLWDRLRALSDEWGVSEDPVLPDGGNTPNPAWSEKFADAAKARGYDGVILETVPGQREMVAFEPKQIKSAIGNSGRFDPESASLADPLPAKADTGRSTEPGSTDAEAVHAAGQAESLAADYTTQEVARLEQTDPDMLVMLEGMDAPRPMSEVLAQIRAEAAQEIADAPLLEVAAQCALRGGA